jgi:hypothetical protein
MNNITKSYAINLCLAKKPLNIDESRENSIKAMVQRKGCVSLSPSHIGPLSKRAE